MKNKRIAVFANGWSNEYLKNVIEGIHHGAKKDGVDVFVFMTYILPGNGPLQFKSQQNIFHLPKPEDFDGAIMLTNTFNIPDERERVCALFQRSGVPMVTTEVKVPGMAFIGSDNYHGVCDMVNHLIEKHNVKNIVYVAGVKGNPECAIRKKAVEDSLHAHGLELMDTLQADFSFMWARYLIETWMNEAKPLPDAFVCANDHMALGVSWTLHQRGVDVPKDVIVTGFDNISQNQLAFPIISTVSKCVDKLGEQAYAELKRQMQKPDPKVEKEYPSMFLPAESCGCKLSKEAKNRRLEKVRNIYMDGTFNEIIDNFCRGLSVAAAKVETKEEFNEIVGKMFSPMNFLSKDFWICTEPAFFELDDEKYPRRIRGYSKKMDVILEIRNNVPIPPYTFHSKEIVPGYRKVPGESNLYILAPLNDADFTIGYIVLKNSPEAVYNLSLNKWLSNMDAMFITMRQYIFAQIANRKLKEVYMTDFLTGMYNRTGCERVLFSFIETAKKEGRTSVLLFSDIDCMKKINDGYGHLNGDIAIKATADAMRKSLPEGWLFGRYGGDEFVAVGEIPDEKLIMMQKENLAKSMKAYIADANLSFRLSASVGFTVIHPEDEGTIDDFIRYADESMYAEKEKAHKRIEREEKSRSPKAGSTQKKTNGKKEALKGDKKATVKGRTSKAKDAEKSKKPTVRG